MNDPNGLIQWHGRYHAFYQHNPNGPLWGDVHWGHAVSSDLVRWIHLPIALAPTPGGPDADGCWSGCAIDDNDIATLIYTGHRSGIGEFPCLATSTDDDLLTWQKYAENPIIADTPPGLDLVGFRDHSVWRQGDEWRMVIGSGIRHVGGAALLYVSSDLRRWRYLHPLCVGETASMGTMWECPDFFALGNHHVLLISQIPDDAVYALIGVYDGERFTVETVQRLDAHSAFYAPQSFCNGAGDRILIGWLREQRPDDALIAAGWAGMLSLPRLLSLDDAGQVVQRPIPELARLRGPRTVIAAQTLTREPTTLCVGLHLELHLEILPGAAPFSLTMQDEHPLATIAYVPDTATLVAIPVEELPAQQIPLALAPDVPLQLSIFVDGSSLEIFANERACVTLRFYAQIPSDVHLQAASETAQIIAGEWWSMAT